TAILGLENWASGVSMQLHNWDVEHHHGAIGDPDAKPYGNGVLLWFETDDFDAAVALATELRAEVVLAPHRNPPDGESGGPAPREIWLRGIYGYTVILASPDGEAGWPYRCTLTRRVAALTVGVNSYSRGEPTASIHVQTPAKPSWQE